MPEASTKAKSFTNIDKWYPKGRVQMKICTKNCILSQPAIYVIRKKARSIAYNLVQIELGLLYEFRSQGATAMIPNRNISSASFSRVILTVRP